MDSAAIDSTVGEKFETKDQRKMAMKRRDLGGRKGEERQKGKGTGCGARFTYKLVPCMHGHEKGKEGNGDCFNLSVRIRYEHNHAIFTTEAWNFLDWICLHYLPQPHPGVSKSHFAGRVPTFKILQFSANL